MAFHYRWSKVFLVTFSFSFLYSCSSSEENGSDLSVVKKVSGQEIYEQKCASCHGGKGDLGISGATDLSTSLLSVEEKIYTITNGSENGKMQPYQGLLSEIDIDAVAHYTETLKK